MVQVKQLYCRLCVDYSPSIRRYGRILRSDFHVPCGETKVPNERKLWIEADFLFPELGDDDDDNSTVAPHFGHMRLNEVNGTPRVRFRLTATMGLDGDIEESMVYVLDINADGSPLTIAQVPRSERNHIHVHYLPARRDPADHIAYGASALLGRMLRAVNWDSERNYYQGPDRPNQRQLGGQSINQCVQHKLENGMECFAQGKLLSPTPSSLLFRQRSRPCYGTCRCLSLLAMTTSLSISRD